MRARAFPLAAELVRAGNEVTIFLPPYDNLDDCGRAWEQEGVRIRNVGQECDRTVRGWARLVLYLRMLSQLIGAVRQFHPDVVHVFKPKGFAGAAATYFLLCGRTPLVLDCDDWEGWGGWNQIKRYPWIAKEYIDRQERWLIKRAHAVTAASWALGARAANLRRKHSGVFYIPNCGASVEGRKVQDAVRSLAREDIRREFEFDGHPVVLYSGHFEDQESVDFFCRATARVAAKHGAVVAFIGNDAPRPIIRRHFHKAEGAHLRFFPQLPYQEFLRLVRASDVAAFPYPDDPVHRAKCSARVTDYMAMERPVLTSAVGQNMEYIVDGESGSLAAPDDESDFAAKLDRLLNEPGLRLMLGENARARLLQKFDWAGEPLQQCLAAYHHALKTGGLLDMSRGEAISEVTAPRDRSAA